MLRGQIAFFFLTNYNWRCMLSAAPIFVSKFTLFITEQSIYSMGWEALLFLLKMYYNILFLIHTYPLNHFQLQECDFYNPLHFINYHGAVCCFNWPSHSLKSSLMRLVNGVLVHMDKNWHYRKTTLHTLE